MEEVGRGGINLFILMLFLIQVHTDSNAERICKSLRNQHAGEELQPGCHPQQRPCGRGECWVMGTTASTESQFNIWG